MNVLYLTIPSYFDLDVSLIREMQKETDIKVLMVLSPTSMKSSAFAIDKLEPMCDIIQAKQYPGIEKYGDVIDLNKWFIANNPDNSFFSCVHLFFKIRKFILDNKTELIHLTNMCKTVFFLIPFLYHFPLTLLTVHDPIPHNCLPWYEELFRRKLFFKANKNLLFLSKVLLATFCKRYGFPQEKIFFSRISVYDVLKKYKISNNLYGEYILFFGRIEPYKGVDLLIKAFKRTLLAQKGVKLVVAGKGRLDHNKKSVEDNIVILNRFIPNDELATLISHCSFVVLPYISATQSGCIMSAFAFNKPVLASNVGNFPVDIIDNVTGLLCEPNDVDDLSKKIDSMYDLDLKQISKNIRRRYQETGEYSWCQIAKELKMSYELIMDKTCNS